MGWRFGEAGAVTWVEVVGRPLRFLPCFQPHVVAACSMPLETFVEQSLFLCRSFHVPQSYARYMDDRGTWMTVAHG